METKRQQALIVRDDELKGEILLELTEPFVLCSKAGLAGCAALGTGSAPLLLCATSNICFGHSLTLCTTGTSGCVFCTRPGLCFLSSAPALKQQLQQSPPHISCIPGGVKRQHRAKQELSVCLSVCPSVPLTPRLGFPPSQLSLGSIRAPWSCQGSG